MTYGHFFGRHTITRGTITRTRHTITRTPAVLLHVCGRERLCGGSGSGGTITRERPCNAGGSGGVTNVGKRY